VNGGFVETAGLQGLRDLLHVFSLVEDSDDGVLHEFASFRWTANDAPIAAVRVSIFASGAEPDMDMTLDESIQQFADELAPRKVISREGYWGVLCHSQMTDPALPRCRCQWLDSLHPLQATVW